MTSEAPAAPAPANGGEPAPNTKPKTPAPREGTKYVILERVEAKDGEGPAWRPCADAQTPAGKDAALKAVADRDGTFKAVPETNWKGGKTFAQEQRTVTVAKDLED